MNELRKIGYVESQNIVFEHRSVTSDSEQNQAATELAALKLDVIVSFGENRAAALQKATSSVPVVFDYAFDPLGRGLVGSLAKPGGNLTGPTSMIPELGTKWLELLLAVRPGLSKVTAIWNSSNDTMDSLSKTVAPAAQSIGQQLSVHPAPLPAGMDGLVQSVSIERAEAIIALWDPPLGQGVDRIINYAIQNRIPTISQDRRFAVAGGLFVYGPDRQETLGSVARYMDRILKGARPADLPVEQPTKFDFVVNLKTAAGAGLSLPQSVLSQATEVLN